MGIDQQPVLFEAPVVAATDGPVYRGVAQQIKSLLDGQKIEGAELAGTIAQALSLSASIDRVSGHVPHTRQAAGMQLSAMHAQLDALLERLATVSGTDPFTEFLNELNGADEGNGVPSGRA